MLALVHPPQTLAPMPASGRMPCDVSPVHGQSIVFAHLPSDPRDPCGPRQDDRRARPELAARYRSNPRITRGWWPVITNQAHGFIRQGQPTRREGGGTKQVWGPAASLKSSGRQTICGYHRGYQFGYQGAGGLL